RTNRYPFNEATREVLVRIEADGLLASVRDYHSQNLLARSGLSRVLMTACPATYSVPHLDASLEPAEPIERVTLSAGVHMAKSRSLRCQTMNLIEAVRDAFPTAELTVAFHHSLGEEYLRAYGRKTSVFREQRRLADWLDSIDVPYVDLSGSHEEFIDYYAATDLHLGYRVHA